MSCFARPINSKNYKIVPANSTFGKIKEPLTSSEYIKNKKSKQVYNEKINVSSNKFFDKKINNEKSNQIFKEKPNYNLMPEKASFGKIKEPLSSSEYIKNKKSIQVFNEQLNFNSFNTQKSYNDFSLFNNGLKLQNSQKCRVLEINKNNLESNLFTILDLSCVPVLSSSTISPTSINLSEYPFFYYYEIDPLGLLFGKTDCGIDNYLNYRKFFIRCEPYEEGTQTSPYYLCP